MGKLAFGHGEAPRRDHIKDRRNDNHDAMPRMFADMSADMSNLADSMIPDACTPQSAVSGRDPIRRST
jgi:hypothetical protein